MNAPLHLIPSVLLKVSFVPFLKFVVQQESAGFSFFFLPCTSEMKPSLEEKEV